MHRTTAILGSALFFLAAPLTFGFVVPWWIAGWRIQRPLLDAPALALAGFVLVIAGSVPLIESFARFALEGRGTPAPIAPPRSLVVTGFYRYVRNPMYVGVLTVMLGNALISGTQWILAYAALVALVFNGFVRLYEEPTLRRQFGAEYAEYCRHVPRWLPRLTPWKPARQE